MIVKVTLRILGLCECVKKMNENSIALDLGVGIIETKLYVVYLYRVEMQCKTKLMRDLF